MRKQIASTLLLSISYLLNCTTQEQANNVIKASIFGYKLLDITNEELVEVCQAMAEVLENNKMHITILEEQQ